MAHFCASFSSTVSPISDSHKKHDVFISYRGEDTRKTFISHLHDAFYKKQIRAYLDSQLPRGDDISSALMQAIQDSYVSVVVFSENYASSRWCLDELIHILHCREVESQLVIPVFYNVDPSHVRHQRGTYEKAFQKHEQDGRHCQHKIQLWKSALTQSADFAGWSSLSFSNDSELIKKIVQDILQKLDRRYPPAELKDLVGIDSKYAEFELFLRKASTIGIWGMGGIGKTTLAKGIFYKCSSQYESCCFLENVRENSGKHRNGLHDLRYKLISKLLDEENIHITTTNIESSFVKCRLNRKKVFIVLDDVSHIEQLEYLVLDGECHFFGQGSRIIITSRDKHVLSKGVDEIYEVKELEYQESLQIFSLNAFNQNFPVITDEVQIKRAVDYTKGNPLALKVLGSFLRGKSEREWDSSLRKFEKIPHENIQHVLRSSYDALDDNEKQIFLDIACFLKGKSKDDVISLLDSFGLYGAIGIRTLQDKALITVNDEMLVNMHDLIQGMGHEIVREESRNRPENRSRLWDSQEIYDVLADNKGTDKIEGIILNLCETKEIILWPGIFKKMTNLRFLELYSSSYMESSHVYLPKGLKFLPNTIQYLGWHGYPMKSLPSTFCPRKLVELHMPHSHVKELWNGVQDLGNLKKIDLYGSSQLMELPDLSKASTLKDINLGACESLRYVHPSILSLESLEHLYLSQCNKLESLKIGIHARSLVFLDAEECSNLKEVSVSAEKLQRLYLSNTGTEKLHLSTRCASNMEVVYLGGSTFVNVPNEISSSKALTYLHLSGCQVIDDSKLQILLDGLRCLRYLYLDECSNITEIPNNIQHVSGLERLSLNNCKRLYSLPKLPPSIKELFARNCTSLETVMSSGPLRASRKEISFQNCLKLNEQSFQNIIEDAHSAMIGPAYRFQQKGRARYDGQSYVKLPGRRVPEWFRYRTTQSFVFVELPPNSYVVDFVFCLVLHFTSTPSPLCFMFGCACFLEDDELGILKEDFESAEMNSDHVFIWNNAVCCDMIMKEIERRRRRRNDQLVKNLKLCFEFSVTEFDYWTDIPIKECGVCPIYASECPQFVPETQSGLDYSIQRL